MNGHDRIQLCLSKFSASQRNTIAEMVSTDCLLNGIWENYVYKYINGEIPDPEALSRDVAERVEETAKELKSAETLEIFDGKI